MQFTKLRITGFKSFVEPAELWVEPGLTGIVGPNGCGKSNLSEALRWVMGESNARRMRGGEMDDVIFNGTDKRPARNLAEVKVVLDNASRTAPAAFNDHDEIEIVRRIERGSGSAYRVNGREARARDVQLLFADLATGAHATGLVSQGKIGQLVTAKPPERRALLEEAAGISGLHSRRHEAELKLKGAETNLTRLDDVLQERAQYLENLRRQAKQAARYRRLNERLRANEALLLHLRWQAVEARAAEARQALEGREAAVAERTGEAAATATARANAESALPDLRQDEAQAAAALQRLLLARDGLDQEEARIRDRATELERQLERIAADAARETDLARDAEQAVARLRAEAAELEAAQAAETETRAAAATRLETARAQVAEAEQAVSGVTERIATAEARQRAIRRQREEVERRRERLAGRRADLDRQRATATQELESIGDLPAAEARVAAAETALAATRDGAEAAERRRLDAQAALAEAAEALHAARDAEGELTSEMRGLERTLESDSAPADAPLIDAVTVAPGLEAALGAAFGDDLNAPEGHAAAAGWNELPPLADPPSLPTGAVPLSDWVEGPAVLRRRLSQIGVVEDADTAARLWPDLRAGQRLVTRDGGLWRWDGYATRAGAPSAAAARLETRNRLAELARRHAAAAADTRRAIDAHDAARDVAEEAAEAEKDARAAVREETTALEAARAARAGIAEKGAALRSRLDSLGETVAALTEDLAEADAQTAQAAQAEAELPDLDAARAEAEAAKRALADRRGALVRAQSTVDGLDREAAARAGRLRAVTEETGGWTRRAAEAERQQTTFAQRAREAEDERAALAARPAALQEQRAALFDKIQDAEAARAKAADQLASAESRVAETNRLARDAEARLSEAREGRVRAEADLEAAKLAVRQMVDRIRERLNLRPEGVLAAARDSSVPEDPADWPNADDLERRLERMRGERDGMGAVNLRAEQEVEELEQQIAGLESEREDLLAAIDRLRQGIASLDREAKGRLLAAFQEVNGHFETLFKKLFGGGKAHLQLTNADVSRPPPWRPPAPPAPDWRSWPARRESGSRISPCCPAANRP